MLRGTVKIVLGTWKVIVSVSSNSVTSYSTLFPFKSSKFFLQLLKIMETKTSNTIEYFMRMLDFECLIYHLFMRFKIMDALFNSILLNMRQLANAKGVCNYANKIN